MRKYYLLLVLSSLTLSATAQTYITHVTLLNVSTNKSIPDQTIVIENDRITNTGPSNKIKIPAGVKVIDATGKYIMPGMTDAHIHFFQTGGLYTRPDGLNLNAVRPYKDDQLYAKEHLPDLMARYLACGITTVIDVGGPFSNYTIRENANKDSLSATTWVTGPLVSTYQPPNLDKNDPPIIKVNSPEEARELVKKQVPYKPDFIKIWYVVRPGQSTDSMLPLVKAAIDESHANGLKVAVHATEYETAKLAVIGGADILVHSIDDKVLDKEMLQLLKTKNVVYIPTLLVSQNYRRTFRQQPNITPHDYQYADPFIVGTITDLQHIPSDMDYHLARKKYAVPSLKDSLMLVNLELAQQAGVNIVSGTDAGNIATFHASSLYTEFQAMQKAGLGNWDIIRSTTINAARGFGKDKDYGSIEKGKIADLILLDKDPVKDLTALENIATVIHRGKVLDAHKLIRTTAVAVVQQQLNAYNARDIDAFLLPYSDSIELYNFNNHELILKGKAAMREVYSNLFRKSPALHCELVNRISSGENVVVDHERVTGAKGSDKVLEAAAVYVVESGKIVRVEFID